MARWWKAPSNRGGALFSALESGREVTDLTPDYVYPVERTPHRRRLRDRDRDPVQDAALSRRSRAVVGAERGAPRAEQRPRRQLDAGAARQELLPRAVGHARRPDRSAPRPGARPQPGGDRAHADGCPPAAAGATTTSRPEFGGNVRWGVTPNLTLNGTDQPGLLAGRGRRQPVHLRSAQRAVLPGEASVLSRRRRAVQRAEQSDLHAADRRAR